MKLFKKNFKQNKKGFTLIELLTTMVIIAILSVVAIGGVTRYVNRSKDQKVVQTKKNIALAAELFVQANRDMLPKEIGESTIIRVSELKNNNYFKDKIVDEDGNDCIANSYVRVFKFSEDEYSYETFLYCGEDEPDFTEESNTKPALLNLKDSNGKDTKVLYTKPKDVKKAFFSFTLVGDEADNTVAIYSYSYSILVRTGEAKDADGNLISPVEVFNSGNIDAQKATKVEVKSKPLSLYFDFTGETVVYVKVRAINVNGSTLDYEQALDINNNSTSQKFNDTEKPICDSIQNGAKNDSDWINKDTANGKYAAGEGPYNLSKRHYPAQVQVLCNDKYGSGCQRELFTKSWPNNEMSASNKVNYKFGARWGFVEIQDNAVNSKTPNGEPNKRKCYVRVNVDIQSPKVKLTFKNTKTGKVVYTTTVEDKSVDGNISVNPLIVEIPDDAYTQDSNSKLVGYGEDGLKWMNKKNFPGGIEISAEIDDNLYLYSYSWQTNNKLLERDETNLEKGLSVDNAKADLTPYADAGISNGSFKVNNAATNTLSGTFANNLTDYDLSQRDLVNSDDESTLNNLHTRFLQEEVGPQHATISGMRLYHEGRRLGVLTVGDRAGNFTSVYIYANIDRTPPPQALLQYVKVGVRENTRVTYNSNNSCNISASNTYITQPTVPNPKYEPADDKSYTKDCPNEAECHWSKEQIRATMDLTNQRDDLYETYQKPQPLHELSGWWKYILTIDYQDPDQPKYQWKCHNVFDTSEHPDALINGQFYVDILPEGVHKITSDSCDNAGNCYSDPEYNNGDLRQYVKIDYTKPICPLKMEYVNVDNNKGFHDHLNNKTDEKADNKGNITFIVPSGKKAQEVGWLKEGESVKLSHACHDSTSATAYTQLWNAPNSFWNKKESFVSPTQSGCDTTSDYMKQSYMYDSDIETVKAGANGFFDKVKNKNVYATGTKDQTIGGHVIDNAGNLSEECPIREVKIDVIIPSCRTLIAYPEGYPVNGSGNCPVAPFDVSLDIPKYSGVKFSTKSCTGWLGLKDGGNGYPLNSATTDKKGKRVTKKTAIVAQDCEDPKSTSTSMMTNVLSNCSEDLMYKVYDFEVKTDVAGAMGVGLGGFIYDNAGNVKECDADKTLNIDYTAPSCTTTITYPEGNPINGTGESIESGWLGFTDNGSGTIPNSCGGENSTPSGSSLSSVERVEYTHDAYIETNTNIYAPLSRAQFAKMIMKALGIDVTSVDTTNASRYYKDLTTSNLSTTDIKYIIAASERGYFVGYTDQTFRPNQTITRVEMTVATMRLAQSLAMPDNCDGSDIPDIKDINDPAMASAFQAAANKCILIGYDDGTFKPNSQANIGQGVLVLYRVLRDQKQLGYECTAKTHNTINAPNWLQEAANNAVNQYTCTLASTEVSRPGSANDPAGNAASSCDTTGDFDGADTTRDKITHNAYIPSGGYYDYDSYISRGEFVKMMLDAADIKVDSYAYRSTKLTDISSSPYRDYIATAEKLGLVEGFTDENGNPNNKFEPTFNVTRAQLAAMLVRVIEKTSYAPNVKSCNANTPDIEDGHWYTEYMRKAAGYCIFVGFPDGLYRPDQYATKAQAITTLNRTFRPHDGMYCDYATTNVFSNVEESFWAYEALYEASNTHTCSVGNGNSDGTLQGEVGDTFVDTSREEIKNTKKTAIISQKCDDLGTYNISIGQNNIKSGCDTRGEKALKSKTYNQEIDHKMAGAVGVGDNGLVFDYAENWTDCNYNPKNFHWVRIDYTRPVCLVMKSYYQVVRNVDTTNGNVVSTTKGVNATRENPNGYDGHWMGIGSYATLQSTCTLEETLNHHLGEAGTSAYRPTYQNSFTFTTSSGSKTHTYENPASSKYQVYTPIQSGCWTAKTAKTSYSNELKTDAATPKGFDVDVYVYDLAGNRSQKACERSIVQIDATAPLCDVVGVHDKINQSKVTDTSNDQKLYFADASAKYKGQAVGASKVTIGLYHKDKWQPDGWLNAEYEVRVVSECNKDDDIPGGKVIACKTGKGLCPCEKNSSLCGTGKFEISGGQNSPGTGCLCSGDNPTAPCTKGYYDTVSPTGNEHQQQRSAVYQAVPNRVFNRMVGSMNAINKTESEGFINSNYDYNSFVGNTITRGEYAMMVIAGLGSAVDCSDPSLAHQTYLDSGTANSSNSGYINTDLTMEEAITCATDLGFFEGRDDGCFDPNAGITRAEMIVGGIRVARILGYSYDQVTPTDTLESDLESNYQNKWYYNELEFAIRNGLIEGEEDLLVHGDDISTRAEAVTYLVRLLQKECDSESGGAQTYYNTGRWADSYLNEAASSYSCDGIQGNAATVYDHVGNMMTCDKIQVKLDDERPKCNNYILTEKNQEPIDGRDAGSAYKWTGGTFQNTELIAISECDDGEGSQCDERTNKTYSVFDKHTEVTVTAAEWKLTNKNLKKSKSNGLSYPSGGANTSVTFESLGAYKAATDLYTGTDAQNGWVKDAVDNITSCDTKYAEPDVFKNELVLRKYGIDYIKPHCYSVFNGGYDIKQLTVEPNWKWYKGTGSVQGNCKDDDLEVTLQSGCRDKNKDNNPPKIEFKDTLDTNHFSPWQPYHYKEIAKDVVGNEEYCEIEKDLTVRIDNQAPVLTGSCSTSASYRVDDGTQSVSTSVTPNDGEGSSGPTPRGHGTSSFTYEYNLSGWQSSTSKSNIKCGGSAGSRTYTGAVRVKDHVGNYSNVITCSSVTITVPGCCDSYSCRSCSCSVSCGCEESKSCECTKYYISNYNGSTQCGTCGTGGNSCSGGPCPKDDDSSFVYNNIKSFLDF